MSKSKPSSTHVLLRIKLKEVKPTVWREVVVPTTITLPKLHHVIQLSMGWENAHLHEFHIAGVRYGVPDPDWDDFGYDVTSEEGKQLLKEMGRSRKLIYLYDLGDGWEHEITVMKNKPVSKPEQSVLCIGGENACPPENIGGCWGYAEYLEAISDKNHPDHEEMIQWWGEGFDPAEFHVDHVNEILNIIKL